METAGRLISSVVSGPAPGRFRPGPLAWWLPASAVVGCAVAWAAAVAERYYAPPVAFPILVGVVLGGVAVALMRVGDVGHRPTILAGGLLAVVVTIAGQHWLAFRQVRRGLDSDPKKEAALRLMEQVQQESPGAGAEPISVPPPQFGPYLRWRAGVEGVRIGRTVVRGGLVWLMWAADGLGIMIPALVLIGVTARLPYCDRCRSWYHTVRSGKMDTAAAHRLAGLAGVPVGGEIRSTRHRLVGCPCGCGPTGLALSWEQPDGDFSSGYVWLDASARKEVLETLDRKDGERMG